jgi:hypothetical protein
VSRAVPVRRLSLTDEGKDDDVKRLSPGERVAMMWQLALQAWMFKEDCSMNRDFVEMLSHRLPDRAPALSHRHSEQHLGVEFSDARPRRLEVTIAGLPVGVIGRSDFIANKRATGRRKDFMDIDLLPDQ